MAASRPRKKSAKNIKATSYQSAPDERWQHNEREPDPETRARVQPPQRLRTIVGTLLASGAIGGEEQGAAARWLRDYELGHHHARDPECVGSGTGSPDGIPIAICDALSRDREATLALGSKGTACMILIAHRCISLSALGRYLNPASSGHNVTKATKLVIETLETLVAHYNTVASRKKDQRKPWDDMVPAHLRPGYRAAAEHRASLPPHPFGSAPVERRDASRAESAR